MRAAFQLNSSHFLSNLWHVAVRLTSKCKSKPFDKKSLRNEGGSYKTPSNYKSIQILSWIHPLTAVSLVVCFIHPQLSHLKYSITQSESVSSLQCEKQLSPFNITEVPHSRVLKILWWPAEYSSSWSALLRAAGDGSGCFFSARSGRQLILLWFGLLWFHYGDFNGDAFDVMLHSGILAHRGVESASNGKFIQSGCLSFWLRALFYDYFTSFVWKDSLHWQDGGPLSMARSLESSFMLRWDLFLFDVRDPSTQVAIVLLGHRDSPFFPFLHLFRLLGADRHMFGSAATHCELPAAVWADKYLLLLINLWRWHFIWWRLVPLRHDPLYQLFLPFV